ncbi:hypothetical protein FKM82_021742 [Ascaphus truei]
MQLGTAWASAFHFAHSVVHTCRVVALSMSPVDDTFISGSLDKTIRLWDLRSPNCQGLMHLQGKPVCSFDPEGLIFAAGINSEVVKLYDLRSFDKGPFATFRMQYDRTCEWTALKFSNDGKLILISTNGGFLRLVDAFKGAVLHTFGGYNNSKAVTLEASFTPDSQFIMIGKACVQPSLLSPHNTAYSHCPVPLQALKMGRSTCGTVRVG